MGLFVLMGDLTHEAENDNIHSLNMNGILRGVVFCASGLFVLKIPSKI